MSKQPWRALNLRSCVAWALECSRFEWIEPDESNGARLRSEATAQRDPFKLQKA